MLGEKSLYWIVSSSGEYSVIAMITAVKVAVPFLGPERGFLGITYSQSFSLCLGTFLVIITGFGGL